MLTYVIVAIIGEAVQYHCNYCRKDISYGVRTRCAVCNDFDLCIECFSVGVELQGHMNDHDYKIIVRTQRGLSIELHVVLMTILTEFVRVGCHALPVFE